MTDMTAEKIKYTASQMTAITKRGSDILVSAGAGSGKTAVMTERIIQLISEKAVNADELLVVTFTRAAAAQMKKKIRTKLTQKARQEKDEYLFKQLTLLDGAQISTVHSLCSNLIKEYYQIAEVDPSFSMLSDTEADILLNEALDEAFEALYEQSEDFLPFVNAFNDASDDEKLKDVIKKVYSFSRNRTDGLNWLENSCEEYNVKSADEFLKSNAVAHCTSFALSEIDYALGIFDKAKAMADIFDKSKKRSIKLAEYIDAAQLLKGDLAKNSFNTFLYQLKALKFSHFDIRKAPCKYEDEIKKLQANARDIIKDLGTTFGFSFSEYYEQTQQTYPYLKSLMNSVDMLEQIYSLKKSQRRGLDYADLEHKALKVLEDEGALSQIKRKYKYVFVDEYQDTNDIQEKIITKIASPGALFTVGDIKQSIYRFREAEPKLFMRRYDSYEKNKSLGSLILLNDNFRSDRKIIEAINELFSKVMFRDSGGIDYEKEGEMLNASKDYLDSEVPQIHTIINTKEVDSEFSDDAESLSNVEIEAMHIAALIKQLLGEEIYDKDSDTMRNIRTSDITILARRMNTIAPVYIKVLKEAGIKVNSLEATDFYDLTEVALALNILKLTDNFDNDIALTSVMRSFLYDFSPDELVKIRAASKDSYYFHECVKAYSQCETDETAAKLFVLLEDLKAFRDRASHDSLEALIRLIYSRSRLYAFAGTLPDGKARQANLRYLKALAASFEQTSMKGLYSFIAFAEKAQKTSRMQKGIPDTNSQNGVNLMTVHKSKGLEFNVVIVADCAYKYYHNAPKDEVFLDKSLGICPGYHNEKLRYKASTLQKSTARRISIYENAAEEMRILYVAATRAIQRLYFTMAVNGNEYNKLLSENPSGVYAAKKAHNYAELIFMGLKGSDKVKFKEFRAGDKQAASIDAIQTQGKDDSKIDVDGINEQIRKNLTYVYPYESDIHVPTKMSVSAIKESETLALGEKIIRLSETPRFIEQSSINASRLGTLTHFILQNIDLAKAKDNAAQAAEEAISKAVDDNIFSSEEAKAINRKAIIGFFASETGNLLTSSNEVKREYEFMMEVKASELDEVWKDSNEEVIVQGVIDCVFKADGKTYILDYKTDKVPDDESLNQLKDIYINQIDAYSTALYHLTGKYADEKIICFINAGIYLKV